MINIIILVTGLFFSNFQSIQDCDYNQIQFIESKDSVIEYSIDNMIIFDHQYMIILDTKYSLFVTKNCPKQHDLEKKIEKELPAT